MQELDKILQDGLNLLKEIKSSQELTNFYQDYLGKTGKVSELMKLMKDIPNEQKKEFGMKINNIKQTLSSEIEAKEKYDLEKIEEEKREKYNPDNIFKKREEEILRENANLPVEIKEESFFKKLVNFIKKFLKI